MRRKRKHYRHGLQREKRVQCKHQEIVQRLKGARDIILIHNTVYLGDQYTLYERWPKKKQELSETCVKFQFPFYGPAAHNDLKLRTEHC